MAAESHISPPWRLDVNGLLLELLQEGDRYVVSLTFGDAPPSWARAYLNWKAEGPECSDESAQTSQLALSANKAGIASKAAAELAELLKLEDDGARLQRIGEWSLGGESSDASGLSQSQRRRLQEIEDEVRRQIEQDPESAQTPEAKAQSADSSQNGDAAPPTEPDGDDTDVSPTDASAVDVDDGEKPQSEPPNAHASALAAEAVDTVNTQPFAAELPRASDLPARDEARQVAIEVRCSDDTARRVEELIRSASLSAEKLPDVDGARLIIHAMDASRARGLIVLLQSTSDASSTWAYTR